MSLDLGSLGKGFAVDKAAELLESAGIGCGLIHGGTSSIRTIGNSADGSPWRIMLGDAGVATTTEALPGGESAREIIELTNESLAVSASWGKWFREGDRVYSHVIDLRTGEPVGECRRAAVALPSGLDCDAWSTALLVLGDEGTKRCHAVHPAARTWLRDLPQPQGVAGSA